MILTTTGRLLDCQPIKPKPAMKPSLTSEQRQTLNIFLGSVERKAFVMAKIAVNNPDDALEIVQDTMLKLTQLYSHKPSEEWPPLFHRILQNHIRDWYRHNKIKTRLFGWLGGKKYKDEESLDPIEQIEAPKHSRPHSAIETAQGNQRLMAALKTLSIRQQQVFILRAWEGMDVKESAFAMNCSTGSVKTHYSRAIHSLREKLQEWDHNE